jgi:hypothetical protein
MGDVSLQTMIHVGAWHTSVADKKVIKAEQVVFLNRKYTQERISYVNTPSVKG